jgi:heparosan-N-sulfate-glucuronate 5-epimerase
MTTLVETAGSGSASSITALSGNASGLHGRAGARGLLARGRYLRRIFSAYLGRQPSQLSFWHEPPELNENAFGPGATEYYQCFFRKADYEAHLDPAGVPLLDYRGHVGLQHNPIAIAQWGLGNFNLFKRKNEPERLRRAARAADWLVANLEPNAAGIPVWKHEFDWEYRDVLRAGWYSALAQGQGISLLCRMQRETGRDAYLDTACEAFRSMLLPVESGGVSLPERSDGAWLEETIVDPPTHILNGFLWAIWGVRDLAAATDRSDASDLLARCTRTLRRSLGAFDCGFWSLYELSGTRLPMLASPFYHRLHISQLEVTARLTGDSFLARTAERWRGYERDPWCSRRALAQKALFKLLYY